MAAPSAWTRLQELFHLASAMDQVAREAFLEKECADDPDLRGQLRALLAASDKPGGSFQTVLEHSAARVFAVNQLAVGDQLGPYELKRLVGHGGMGSVFLALRADGAFTKDVAIKFVRTGFDGLSARERFRTERQILAGLDHPNIARLLDGGEGPDGQPFVAMEFVDGVPLDSYARDRKLSINERIDLFRQICAGVAYAHRNLVVHRDIKPANILVTADGTPKLVDFGIAKLLSTAEELPSLTRTGERAMTLDYASPEQVLGQSITTASDIYSLGVVLYELLTGVAPYRVAGARPSEAERVICELEPVRPSKQTPAGEHAKLARQLRGDLDNIVLKALRKEPERRYGSVDELSDDLRRHREGYPVLARSDTWQYRAAKFVTRHKAGVAVGVAVALSLAALFAAVVQERNTARAEREKAQQASRFLVESFRVSDPSESRGQSLTAREVLQRGAQRVDRDLQSQPGTRATILRTLSEVYASIGLYQDAQSLIDRAVTARQAAGEAGTDDAREDQIQLARVLLTRGEWQKSADRLRQALPFAQTLPQRSAVLYHLGMAQTELGKWQDAKQSLDAALALRRTQGDEASVAQTLYGLSSLCFRQGDYRNNLELAKQAYAIRQRLFGAMHPDVADSLQQMASACDGLGQFDESLRLAHEALAMQKSLYGETHLNVASSLNDLAAFFARAGRLEDSRDTHLRALAVYRKVLGEKHPLIALSLDNLGATLYELGDREREETVKRQAMAIRRELFGETSMEYANSLNSWGVLLYARGRIADGEPFLRRALQLRRQFHSPDARTVAVSEMNLGSALERQGKTKEAIPLLESAYATFRKSHGPTHPSVARSAGMLGTCKQAQGDLVAAESYFQQAMEAYGPDLHQAAWSTLYGLALLRLQRGDVAAAETLLRRAHLLAKKYPGQVGFGAGLVESALGRCLLRQRRAKEGLPLLRSGRLALSKVNVCARCEAELAWNRQAGN